MKSSLYLGAVLALAGPAAAHTVDYTITIYETPADASAETLSGYSVINVASGADAAGGAARAPSVAHGGRAIARLHLPMAGK